MNKTRIIEKIGEISIKVYTIGKCYGMDDLTELSKELNELVEDVFSADEWETGIPMMNGTYLAQMDNKYAPYLVLDRKRGKWFINGTTQECSDWGIMAFQFIRPYEAKEKTDG